MCLCNDPYNYKAIIITQLNNLEILFPSKGYISFCVSETIKEEEES